MATHGFPKVARCGLYLKDVADFQSLDAAMLSRSPGVRIDNLGRQMLIKAADDTKANFDALNGLLARPDVDSRRRRLIETEIRTMSAGRKSEEDAAYQIDFWIRNDNLMVIHDLRLEHRGRVAQIDHLIINRFLEILVCESKSFKEGVVINDHGEWMSVRRGGTQGIASPIAQNERHIAVLTELFEDGVVDLPKRLGRTIRPEFKSIVLVSNNARITRPRGAAATRIKGLDSVIKVDQLKERFDASADEREGGQLVAAVAFRLVSAETAQRVARDLAALHAPILVDWAKRFGLSAEPPESRAPEDGHPVSPSEPTELQSASAAPSGTTTCASCAVSVSAAVVAYCEAHPARFSGQVLCYQCQRRRGRSRAKDSAEKS